MSKGQLLYFLPSALTGERISCSRRRIALHICTRVTEEKELKPPLQHVSLCNKTYYYLKEQTPKAERGGEGGGGEVEKRAILGANDVCRGWRDEASVAGTKRKRTASRRFVVDHVPCVCVCVRARARAKTVTQQRALWGR